MSPGLRLLLVPALALAGAFATSALPPTRRWGGVAPAVIVSLLSAGLLVSLLGTVGGGGVVERGFPDLVRGVPLGVRGDQTGVVLTLAACGGTLAVLIGALTSPLERTGLLLCFAGTAVACLGANLYLLFGGLELGNAGALLMAVGGSSDPRLVRRAKLSFAVQHAGSLGVLASALQLSSSVHTASFGAIPPEALGVGVALPWAAAGVLRLGAAAALPARGRNAAAAAWLAVAAAPTGLVVLLRLEGAATSGLPTRVTVLLGGAGLGLAAAGAAAVLRRPRDAPAAMRGLLCALGGQVVVAMAVGTPAARTAAAALGLALMAAAIAARATALDLPSAGRPRRLQAAVALLGGGGLPVGVTTTALLAATGAEVAGGTPHALVATAAGACAVAAALAAGRAARAVLDAPTEAPAARPWWRHLDLDVLLALGGSAVLGVVPGVLLTGLAERLAGSGNSLVAIDAGAIRGPGFGWAGGYLELAVLVTVVAGVSAAQVYGASWRRWPGVGGAVAPTVIGEEPADEAAPLIRELVARAGSLLDGVDRWLVTQPDIRVLLAGAGAALVWYTLRR